MRRRLDDLDQPRQRRHQRSQRVQLFVAETARMLGGPARCVNRAVGGQQRQRDIIGDAFGCACRRRTESVWLSRIVDPRSDLALLAEHDRQRTVDEFRRIQEIKIGRADGDLGARPPDEIAAENIRMQGADEDADPPQRQAGPTRRSHISATIMRRARRRPRAVDHPVDDVLQVGRVHDATFAALLRKRQGAGNALRLRG